MENAHCVDQRLGAEASEALPRLAAPTVSRAETLARFLRANAELLAKQGTVTEVWRRRGARRLGPYYQLRYRDIARRQRALYLGPAGELVDSVRRALAERQAPRRLQRLLALSRNALRREAAAARRQLDEELRRLGLRLQGHEIRGWSRRSDRAAATGDEPGLTASHNRETAERHR